MSMLQRAQIKGEGRAEGAALLPAPLPGSARLCRVFWGMQSKLCVLLFERRQLICI